MHGIISAKDLWQSATLDPLSPDRRMADPIAPGLDPASVQTDRTPLDPQFKALVSSQRAAPRAAEAAARRLLALYGPFTADNTAEHRAAIISHLQWLCGSAIRYDHARFPSAAMDTQPPNTTVSTLSGVCRDTHTAAAAILAALMTAKHGALGPCTGQEANVLAAGFHNPDESHAFLAYRDPGTGGWNTLEYGKHYALRAANWEDAITQTVGFTAALRPYRLRGWDRSPIVDRSLLTGAADALDFFTRNPGQGTTGDVTIGGGDGRFDATLHVSRGLALSVQATTHGNGGAVHWNDAWSNGLGEATLHVGVGAYQTRFEASPTGRRARGDRNAYTQLLLGAWADGTWEGREQRLAGDHLRLSVGGDANAMLAVPLADAKRPDAIPNFGGIGDYSRIDGSVHALLSGQEQAFDWQLWARAQLNGLSLAEELITSAAGGEATAMGALSQAPSAGGRIGLDASKYLRLEAGAQALRSTSEAVAISLRGYQALRAGTDALSLTALCASDTTASLPYASVRVDAAPAANLVLSAGIGAPLSRLGDTRIDASLRATW